MTSNTTDLKISISEPRSWARRLTITVPGERVQHERRALARSYARRIKLPGFRQGKVPPGVVERKFGPAIEQEAVEKVVGEAYREALERERLEPITQGEVENLNYSNGSDLVFEVEFEIRPVIELSRIGGFQIERERAEVTDEDVERTVEMLREQQATWHPIEDETPVDGDRVDIEITPEAEGAKPRRYQIVLGQGQALPPVEEAVRTLRPGEERDFVLLLPDPEAEDEDATREERVRIRLREAQRPELPALDDEFARSLGDFDDLDTLRARIREDLEREADEDAERGVRQRLLDQIIEANPFDVPDSMVHQYVRQIVGAPEGADPERLAQAWEMARPVAERALRRSMVIERIAEMEGLHATSAEVDDRVEAIAERQGRPVGEVWAQLQKSGQLARLEEQITEDKVFEYLKAQSTIV